MSSKAIKLFISRVRAKFYHECGSDNSNRDQYKEALADFDKAIELNPQHAKAHHNRGFANRMLGHYDKGVS